MKVKNILEAEEEAKRFLSKLKELKKSEINGEVFNSTKKINETHTSASKETGALKRSSLDLSRALSKLRNDIW